MLRNVAAIVHGLRELLRLLQGRAPAPSAVILDSRTRQSTPESGARAGDDGTKRKKGSKVHLAVDTLGQLSALHVTPANVPPGGNLGRSGANGDGTAGSWPWSIKAPPEPYAPPSRTASTWRRSNCPAPSAVRVAAASLGGGAEFRLDGALPPPCGDERWRTTVDGVHFIAVAVLALKTARPV